MAERNIFTTAAISVADKYKRDMKAKRPKAVPFMMEKVRGQKAMDEIERMSPEEREKLMGRVGIAGIRDMLKRQG